MTEKKKKKKKKTKEKHSNRLISISDYNKHDIAMPKPFLAERNKESADVLSTVCQ